jgi:glycerol-3-phosphate dehydrogenase
LAVEPDEINGFLDEINEALPDLRLTPSDVLIVNAGLLPFGENNDDDSNLSFGKRSLIVNQSDIGGPAGLVSAVSVRWTMGRATAEQAVDLIESYLQRAVSRSQTEFEVIFGGDFATFADLRSAIDGDSILGKLDEDLRENIAVSYGSNWTVIRKMIEQDPDLSVRIDSSDVVAASVAHAARSEHVVHLADVLLRRTDIATGAPASNTALRQCATIVASELAWSATRISDELSRTRALFPFSNKVAALQLLQGAA